MASRGNYNDPMSPPGTSTGTSGSSGFGQAASTAVESVKEEVSSLADRARDTASNVSERARDMASNVAHRAGDMASSFSHSAQDMASNVAHRAQDMAATVGHKAEDAVDDLTRLIRRYPMQSVLAGLGIGFLLAQVMRSKDR